MVIKYQCIIINLYLSILNRLESLFNQSFRYAIYYLNKETTLNIKIEAIFIHKKINKKIFK